METKGSQNVSANNLATIPIDEEDDVVYIAIKGSLHANDCSVFGLSEDEIVALTKKFSGPGTAVINGVQIKTTAIKAINALSQLGYRVVSSSGEGETTWTLKRNI
ncbi:uncharacterized protein LOC121731017 [Aricia agestis]|uniref:uncharacterized protein LOC121731017 n=1 Tax=Aricia agestis TaxID=91739 RepID=UPI001C204565|nr:uncharacterized protein LOC121731017 [Aricia agestis]